MSDASRYAGIDSVYLPGDGDDFDVPVLGNQVATGRVAGIGRWGWRDDNNNHGDPCIADQLRAATGPDRGGSAGDAHGNTDAAADQATDRDTDSVLLGGAEPSLRPVESDTDQDPNTAADIDTDASTVRDTGCEWSLPAILLA